MNRDDIISMAREADLKVGTNLSGVQLVGSPSGQTIAHITVDELERFAALVAAHTLANIDPSSFTSYQEGYEAGRLAEREACAKLVDLESKLIGKELQSAAAIRARGEA